MTTIGQYFFAYKLLRKLLTVSLAHLAGEEGEDIVLGIQGVDLALHVSCVFWNIQITVVQKLPNFNQNLNQSICL